MTSHTDKSLLEVSWENYNSNKELKSTLTCYANELLCDIINYAKNNCSITNVRLLCKNDDRPYEDIINGNHIVNKQLPITYKGQKKNRTFDNDLMDPNIPKYILLKTTKEEYSRITYNYDVLPQVVKSLLLSNDASSSNKQSVFLPWSNRYIPIGKVTNREQPKLLQIRDKHHAPTYRFVVDIQNNINVVELPLYIKNIVDEITKFLIIYSYPHDKFKTFIEHGFIPKSLETLGDGIIDAIMVS